MPDLYRLLFVKLPRRYRRADAVLHGWVIALLLVAIIVRVVNAATHGFTISHFAEQYISAVPGVMIVWIVGVSIRDTIPRLGLLLSSFSQSFLFILAVDYALSGIITTPFPTIDHVLLSLDQHCHFSTLNLMTWTYEHIPWCVPWLHFCYNTWVFQLIITPIALALWKDEEAIDHYMVATFASLLIGSLIYYFWPTIAPAGILESPYFLESQHQLVQRFQEIHHSLPISVFGGGMIAFPSFHVINSVLVTYAWRRRWYIVWPLCIVNIFSISATLTLGYHYLVDVLSGFAIAYFTIRLTRCMLKYSRHSEER